MIPQKQEEAILKIRISDENPNDPSERSWSMPNWIFWPCFISIVLLGVSSLLQIAVTIVSLAK